MASWMFVLFRYRAVKFAVFMAKVFIIERIMSGLLTYSNSFGVILAILPILEATISPGRPRLCELVP